MIIAVGLLQMTQFQLSIKSQPLEEWPDLVWVALIIRLESCHESMQCEALEYAVRSLIHTCFYYLWNEVLALVERSIKLVVLSYSVFFFSLCFGLQKDVQFLNLAFL